jgi:hypothetical protein
MFGFDVNYWRHLTRTPSVKGLQWANGKIIGTIRALGDCYTQGHPPEVWFIEYYLNSSEISRRILSHDMINKTILMFVIHSTQNMVRGAVSGL